MPMPHPSNLTWVTANLDYSCSSQYCQRNTTRSPTQRSFPLSTREMHPCPTCRHHPPHQHLLRVPCHRQGLETTCHWSGQPHVPSTLSHQITGYANVLTKQMLTHLYNQYRTTKPSRSPRKRCQNEKTATSPSSPSSIKLKTQLH